MISSGNYYVPLALTTLLCESIKFINYAKYEGPFLHYEDFRSVTFQILVIIKIKYKI
jgi:hypothetical protein